MPRLLDLRGTCTPGPRIEHSSVDCSPAQQILMLQSLSPLYGSTTQPSYITQLCVTEKQNAEAQQRHLVICFALLNCSHPAALRVQCSSSCEVCVSAGLISVEVNKVVCHHSFVRAYLLRASPVGCVTCASSWGCMGATWFCM